MEKEILEIWGHAFLNAARSRQYWEDVRKIFGQSASADNAPAASGFPAAGWPNSEKMTPEEIAELTQKSVSAFQEFFKAYLNIFDVVSREEYLKLVKENEALKEKIAEQEKIITDCKNQTDKDSLDQERAVDDLTRIMENQTKQFQKLLDQVNQYYKDGKTAKRK